MSYGQLYMIEILFSRTYVFPSTPAGIRDYVAPNACCSKLKLNLQQGLSAFDLAAGRPAIGAILSPWKRVPGGISPYHDSLKCLLQFISRTARILAHTIEEGTPAITKPNCSMGLSLAYFFALRGAFLLLISAREAGHFPVTEWIPTRDLVDSCRHAHAGDTSTAVPVKRAEILREYRSLFSDTDDQVTCDYCDADVNLDFYVCPICLEYCCPACQYALSVLSLRERFEEFGRLRRSRNDVVAVLQALEPIKHHNARVTARVLSQAACLQHWVSRKNEDYREWRSSRTIYDHFQQDKSFDWKAIHTMKSVISLSTTPSPRVLSDMDGAELEGNDDGNGDWSEVTQEWHDVFAFNILADDLRAICSHHCRMYLKKPRLDEDAALDSSGKLSAEFFHFLAEKYGEATNIEMGIMEFLESKRFPGGSFEDLAGQKPNFVPTVPLLEHLTTPGESSKDGYDRNHLDASQMRRDTIDDSEDSSSDDPSPGSSRFIFPERSLENDDGTEIDLEDFLDSLLAKRNSLINEGRLTKEEDLILNTAWNMAQAIIYRGTPRPSLEEISDKGEDFCTAPTTPAPSHSGGSHGGNTPSSYGTPRSMSPLSWVMDLDQEGTTYEFL